MAKKDEDRLDKLEGKINDISAKIRRMSDNWKKFAAKFIGSAEHKDGALDGSIRIYVVLFLGLIAFASLCFATDNLFNLTTTKNGTAKIVTDNAGTATYIGDKVQADSVVVSTNKVVVGYFAIVNTTQLVFVASGKTNAIDSDITTP